MRRRTGKHDCLPWTEDHNKWTAVHRTVVHIVKDRQAEGRVDDRQHHLPQGIFRVWLLIDVLGSEVLGDGQQQFDIVFARRAFDNDDNLIIVVAARCIALALVPFIRRVHPPAIFIVGDQLRDSTCSVICLASWVVS